MSARGTLDGIESPVPFIGLLPAIYQEDFFTERFTGGFDDVLAPVFTTLDSLEAYVDPRIAPVDFLAWLGGWVGLALAEDWPIARQRDMVASIVPLYRLRGTLEGLREEVRILTGGDVEISESGGVAVSQSPGAALPGQPSARLAVRVRVDDPSTVRMSAIEAIVAAAKPAHVVHRIEIASRL